MSGRGDFAFALDYFGQEVWLTPALWKAILRIVLGAAVAETLPQLSKHNQRIGRPAPLFDKGPLAVYAEDPKMWKLLLYCAVAFIAGLIVIVAVLSYLALNDEEDDEEDDVDEEGWK